jgi:hypothetical protein
MVSTRARGKTERLAHFRATVRAFGSVEPVFTEVAVTGGAAVNGQRHRSSRGEDPKAYQFDCTCGPSPPIANSEPTYPGSDEYPDDAEAEKIIANSVSPASRLNDLFFGHFLIRPLCCRFFCSHASLDGLSIRPTVIVAPIELGLPGTLGARNDFMPGIIDRPVRFPLKPAPHDHPQMTAHPRGQVGSWPSRHLIPRALR